MPPSFEAGHKAKSIEIESVGWAAARDEFNRVHPPGQPWTGSADGLSYAQGEYAALCESMDRRIV